jgi:hypothetical protein
VELAEEVFGMQILVILGVVAHLLVLESVQRVALSERGVELGEVLDIGELLVQRSQRLGDGIGSAFVGLLRRDDDHGRSSFGGGN